MGLPTIWPESGCGSKSPGAHLLASTLANRPPLSTSSMRETWTSLAPKTRSAHAAARARPRRLLRPRARQPRALIPARPKPNTDAPINHQGRSSTTAAPAKPTQPVATSHQPFCAGQWSRCASRSKRSIATATLATCSTTLTTRSSCGRGGFCATWRKTCAAGRGF